MTTDAARRSSLTCSAALTLAILAFTVSLLLAWTHHAAQEAIARRDDARIRALTREMLPDAVRHQVFTVSLPSYGGATITRPIYAGYDASDAFIGIVVETSDSGGYGGEVRVVYGYLPHKQSITGVKILKETETSGIGDRIRTDPEFLAQFEEMALPLQADTKRPQHPVSYVPPETNGGPGQVEGISGATVSSRAVIRAMRISTNQIVPAVHDMLDELKGARQ